MSTYKQFQLIKDEYIFEKVTDTSKNLHLEHIEDLILDGGVVGTRSVINFLQALRDMLAGHSSERKVNVTTKFDGAPAIFAGINPENGKFFVGTKGVFAGTPKLNYTPQDIDQNHPGDGLNRKLKIALQYLPQLGIHSIIQGDMMFTHEDLKYETIDGQEYVTFQPNTIVYAVPADSALANQITQAKMGVVWHTSYVGKTIADMKASFTVNVNRLKPSKDVWFRGATFVDDSGVATFTEDETKELTQILTRMGMLFRQISPRVLNQISTMDTYRIEIKTWNNTKVRAGEKITNTAAHVQGLIRYVESKINKEILNSKKMDTRVNREKQKNILLSFYRGNAMQLKMIFDLQNLVVEAKNKIIGKLQQVKSIGTFIKTSDGFRVTHPEGFVAIDHLGKAVKLVDRLNFSHLNFTITKNW